MHGNKIKFQLEFREITLTSFLFAVVSGILLFSYYNISDSYISITKILLLYPLGNVIRNIHYWSAQLFFISVLLQFYNFLKKKNPEKVNAGGLYLNGVTIGIVFFIILSGFFLKSDADSKYTYHIINSVLQYIPYIGNILSAFFAGDENNIRITFVQHITLSFIYVVLFFTGKSFKDPVNIKHIYPIALFFLVIGIIFNAPLHDNINPFVKGPWYFIFNQEILYWINKPVYLLLILLALFLFFMTIPLMQTTHSLTNIGERHYYKISGFIRKILWLSLVVYSFLTLFGLFFRGENWKFELPWNNNNLISIRFNSFDVSDSLRTLRRPVVLGRYEGCLYCHNQTKGLTASHDVNSTGCQSCHAGNPFTLNKWLAHRGMFLIPGNLSNANRTCGSTKCHPDVTARVNNSIMNTMSGVVSVDKYVFGEYPSPSVLSDIKKINDSPADKHLRNLCASCHLNKEKTETGEVSELSRDGGCIACHLNYSDNARIEISIAGLHAFHPDINLNASNDHCFGCHSRSGRISTNYEGWFETLLNENDVKGKAGYRLLADGRIFEKHEADVHFENGMQCIDCHLSYEIMGDGNAYSHKEEQVKIQCIDCHSNTYQNYSNPETLDYEANKILKLRNWDTGNKKYLKTSKAGYNITNAHFDSTSTQPVLQVKSKGNILPLKQPLDVCIQSNSHKRLSCNSCHSSRVSQCVGCHTEYNNEKTSYDLLDDKEVKGEWVEHSGQIYNELPTLGIRTNKLGDNNYVDVIETFTPGMVLRIDKDKSNTLYKRLFSPISAHTTTRASRTCKSCHNNPVALGYGRGELQYQINGSKGKWVFTPVYGNEKFDGLPSDAWIGFLQNSNNNYSTRDNIRPFNIDEQNKILMVGACLTCHEENSVVIKRTLIDFKNARSNISRRCILPE
jgi:hypothetical protein